MCIRDRPHHSRPVARKPPPRRTGSLKTAPHQPAGMTASLRIADAGIWVLTGESHRSFPFRPELWVGRVLVNPKRGDLISDFHLSGCFCGGESKHDGETAESAPNTNPHRRRALLPGQHLKPATPGRLFEEAPSLKAVSYTHLDVYKRQDTRRDFDHILQRGSRWRVSGPHD